ncbi:hypothetical protein [Microbacterium immunditiarum]|uniref:Uncharacterized protein n=1 Tax=Microbacterium immunditiarum TaxID=337480 RepID=A0A7Y9GPY9_9MICO|nr:hypothetical protein [Microbacterium immunditiarum]NYE20538.1 hypothetical protein [Microbacterium immunditiarum]
MDRTRRPARRAAVVAAMVVGAVLALASCAPVSDEDTADATATPTPTQTTEAPTPTPTGNGSGGNGNGGDGPVDPAQQTRRSGPAAEYGGPPFGDQGAEFLGDGQWCSTVALFWGDAPPPVNVAFTIDGVASHPAGALSAQPQVCGNAGATTSCIGFTMTPETGSVFCSMLLTAGPSFPGQATVTFVGTLVCTEAQYCDAAMARPASPGPPIVITDPGQPDEEPDPPTETDPPIDDTESPESEAP